MRKLTLTEMQAIANSRGGKCLSSVYIGTHHKLEWECANGHRWESLPSSIKQGTWCPICVIDKKKRTLNEMQELARIKEGLCLSTEYVNTSTRLIWKCASGHIWESAAGNIIQGAWCPTCAGVEKGTIEDLKTLAQSRGGRCISEVYVNAVTKLEWECSKGHKWWAKPTEIRKGHWCLICSGKEKKTIEDMKKLAQSRGGKCLSEVYVNAKTKMEWECAKGHKWRAKPMSIIRGTWCRKCSGYDKKTMNDMVILAQGKGGKFISQEYINDSSLHEWECAEGHRWMATPNTIKSGEWCPLCADNLSERICRHHFEQIFGNKFPSRKPKWLLNSRNGRMELDGYCEELGIAFEYNGVQHYRRHKRFHSSEESYYQRLEDDRLKKELCATNKVKLVTVPYTVPYEKFKFFILESCKRLKITLPPDAYQKKIDFTPAYSREKIGLMQELAEKHGGKCLSKHYVNAHTKLEWECPNGHRWWAKPNNIQQGEWCGECGKRKKRTLQDLVEVARNHGGKCLSTEYKGVSSMYEWRCKVGHKWKASGLNVLYGGSWCPYCYGKAKPTIEQMRSLASERGGRCLSSEYKNNRQKLLWECSKKHTWMATASLVKNKGYWCPKCAAIKKKGGDPLTH